MVAEPPQEDQLVKMNSVLKTEVKSQFIRSIPESSRREQLGRMRAALSFEGGWKDEATANKMRFAEQKFSLVNFMDIQVIKWWKIEQNAKW